MKRNLKLMKDLLIMSINALTIAKLYFEDFDDAENNSIILDMTLGQIIFLRTFTYKSSEAFSVFIFFVSVMIRFEINDYKIIYCFVTIFLIMIIIANEIKDNKICQLCQLSNNDLFFSLNEDFNITSANYNLTRYLKENKVPLRIFVDNLLKNEICVKKEYHHQPDIKEIISDILMDIEQSKVMNLENYIGSVKDKNEKILFCIGKIDVLQNKNEVMYIMKKKKKILIKIKRDKAFEEALNLRTLTKNYAKTIYYIAHELRNPLNCVLNLELIDSNEKYSFETLSTEFLQPAIISSKVMLNLVSGLLDFAQIEANTFKLLLSKFDIRNLSEEILQIYKIQTKNRGLIMELDVDPDIKRIISDPNRIKQILINLISNHNNYNVTKKVIISLIKVMHLNTQITGK